MSQPQKNIPSSKELTDLIEKLSPLERKVIPHLNKSYEEIKEKTELDDVSLLRALKFLQAKGALKMESTATAIVDLGTNGIYYKKNHLPERQLLMLLEQKNHLSLEEAHKESKLSDNEFKVSLGVLKSKAILTITEGKLILNASREEIMKKTLEEQLLEILPRELASLPPELVHAYETLKKRKEIVELREEKKTSFTLSALGQALVGQKIDLGLIEEVTSEVIKSWSRGKKFRKYDIHAPVPHHSGGKRHFVNHSIEYARRVWLDLGFQEMTGPLVDTSFWIFDALFTPQDHPARELQDTFFIKDLQGNLPAASVVKSVKESHEKGVGGSPGWQAPWHEKEAKKLVLRTHTTGLSARTLSTLSPSQLPAKYFSIGKVFRNETLDWSHLFEFYQTDGIVVSKNLTFTHLLGYLKEFYRKMGYDKIKFVPSFFPYTEPSVEVHIFHPERKIWVELGGAGLFRPEVTIPLLKDPSIRVLAWGQGFERIIMEYYKIKDLREVYQNDIRDLRARPLWRQNE